MLLFCGVKYIYIYVIVGIVCMCIIYVRKVEINNNKWLWRENWGD